MLAAIVLATLVWPSAGYLTRSLHAVARPSTFHASSLVDETTTELPDSFEAAVTDAVSSTLASTADGWTRLRIDFDTSAGDATYTMLKNSLPMTQKFIAQITEPLLAQFSDSLDSSDGGGDSDEKVEDKRTVRLYFPDAGSAALCQRDWKVGQPGALVPSCVRLSSLSMRDLPAKTDACLVFVCPRATEVDALKTILKVAGAWDDVYEEGSEGAEGTPEVPEIPVIFINPELVNMGVVGFGLSGRMLREQLLATLVPSYYLRTLQWGAVTRAYPKPFSVWRQDDSGASPGGYRLLSSSDRVPEGEELDNLYEASGGDGDGGGMDTKEVGGMMKGLNAFASFVEGFGRI
mmetsp:Transcript_5389/g.10135  ORF Transcript_5389/g.10135 Transcript_5389/m.10135 type:complete len:348 (+) Transcript_5389:42-1085(+)